VPKTTLSGIIDKYLEGWLFVSLYCRYMYIYWDCMISIVDFIRKNNKNKKVHIFVYTSTFSWKEKTNIIWWVIFKM
jgi:hypothetical protein